MYSQSVTVREGKDGREELVIKRKQNQRTEKREYASLPLTKKMITFIQEFEGSDRRRQSVNHRRHLSTQDILGPRLQCRPLVQWWRGRLHQLREGDCNIFLIAGEMREKMVY